MYVGLDFTKLQREVEMVISLFSQGRSKWGGEIANKRGTEGDL